MTQFIIKKPIITEKSSLLSESGVYTFEVEKTADKTQIKAAVERGFEVKVESVKTVICRGRSKRTVQGYTKPRYWKKAMVKLKEGETIKMFEGGAN